MIGLMNIRTFQERFNTVDNAISAWMRRNAPVFLRYSLGVIFVWFGGLKVVGQSPAGDLVANTVYWFDPAIFIPVLGWWEVMIGVFMVYRPAVRIAIFLLALQMGGTFMPLVLLPETCFQKFPFILTMEGQYIVKNLLIIGAAMVVGGTVRMPEEIKNKIHP